MYSFDPINSSMVAEPSGESSYVEWAVTLDELAKELEFRDLNNQYYFGTQKAIELLKRL